MPLHLDDIRFQLGDGRVVTEDLQRQLHSGERRAQIVRHPGQHLGALADLALDAVAHREEGDCRLAHFDGALDFEKRRRSGPLPKLSAATASRRSDFTWLRKNTAAIASNTTDEPTIQMTKI